MWESIKAAGCGRPPVRLHLLAERNGTGLLRTAKCCSSGVRGVLFTTPCLPLPSVPLQETLGAPVAAKTIYEELVESLKPAGE